MPVPEPQEFQNFGGNFRWNSPCYRPTSEDEVLTILAQNRGRRIRAVGSLHSWSAAPVTDGIVLDMSGLRAVSTFHENDKLVARVGAGASLQEVLDHLHAHTTNTLPTLGAIKKQTLSGAISTATHGSGRPSLSHFVRSLRVASYDPVNGEPRIAEYNEGGMLRAARCSLGALGVILSIDMETAPQYLVEESLIQHDNLDSVLSTYPEMPLTQFILAPYCWSFVGFHRRALPWRPLTALERLRGKLTGLLNYVGVDFVFHALLKVTLRLGPGAVKSFMRKLPALMVKGQTNIGPSEQMLTLAHDLFQHEEMEVFIPESRLGEAVDIVRYAVSVLADEPDGVPEATLATLRELDLLDPLEQARGSYTHHYPIAFRKVPAEDTMIGMASGTQSYFSCSLFTYRPPAQRQDFEMFCAWLSSALYQAVDARLHWGKHFPLTHDEMEMVYPELERFREIVSEIDGEGVFRNEFVERVLGL